MLWLAWLHCIDTLTITQVRTAMADSNYCLFFKLYRSAPAMGAYLMDYCVDRLRKAALNIMTKAFRPIVPVAAVNEQLGFEDMDACEAYLTAQSGREFTPAVKKTSG